jgi:transposase
MDAQALDPRRQRGFALAKTKGSSIKVIVPGKYLVPSATGQGGYVVDVSSGKSCTCPDWQTYGPHQSSLVAPFLCKHVVAVLVVTHEITLPDGNVVVVEEKKRINYPRIWPATNAARTKIPQLGPALLADLIGGMPIIEERKATGRPPVPERDILLAAALRAFEDMTAGATVVAAQNYNTLGLTNLTRIPSYNTLLREFAKPKYMPHLHRLIAGSALPLIALEDTFIVDGTGFGSSVYDCYYTEKHGDPNQRRTPTKKHRWVQSVMVWGRITHGIVAMQVTESNVGEGPLMPELVRRVQTNGGKVGTWLADAAYMSWYNVKALDDIGAEAFIDFPKGVTGVKDPGIRRLYLKMSADPEEYRRRYHQRVLGESGNNMIKTRFSHRLRSRVPNAQYAECMLRAVAHNVAMLVQAVEELGIEPKYWAPTTTGEPASIPLLGAPDPQNDNGEPHG